MLKSKYFRNYTQYLLSYLGVIVIVGSSSTVVAVSMICSILFVP